jgi:aquaporin Z
VTELTGVVVEAILTIFLLWVVFGTAVSPLAPRIGGFGIGLMVAADILGGGPITGAAMNPARWLGTAIPAGFYDHWYVYFVGPLIGAAIAALSYRYIFAPPPDLAPSEPVTPRP